MARFYELYQKTIKSDLIKDFKYKNSLQAPRLTKIVLNMGLGDATRDAKILDSAAKELAAIAGQKPIVTYAKKSIAGFKVREGMKLGLKVTLRGKKMYEFLDRLVTIAMPRVRDFRGLSAKSFDGKGNYSLGIKEQIVFPEVEYDKIDKIRGLDVCIVTTSRTNEEAKKLLEGFGMPFTR